MSTFLKGAMRDFGWRLGLQSVTGVLFSTFILGIFYRSATLYHPQRRAILHLKSQKRKIKDKNKSQEDKLPFFDFSSLKSRTFQIILLSSFITSLGMFTPFMFLVSTPTCFVTVMTVFCISALSKRTRKRGNYRRKSNSNLPWACLGLWCFYVWTPHCKELS